MNEHGCNNHNLLHICSDFPNQHIYMQLINQLRALGEKQFMFSAVRSDAEAKKQPPDDGMCVRYSIQNILHPWHIPLFRTKIKMVEKTLCQTVDPKTFSIVHAHYLYSDGAVALRLKQKFGIPFISAIRNTDLNAFMRFRPDLRMIAYDILRQASALVCLTDTYRDAVLSRLPKSLATEIRQKFFVIPSGVPDSWLQSSPSTIRESNGEVKVLYVGNFNKNKNVVSLIKAVKIIRTCRVSKLTLVGGGGDGLGEIKDLLRDPQYSFVTLLGPIYDAVRLRDIYREHDVFAMPSFLETFGVVYLEALSQGVPIVHTKGQGVDGLFEPSTVSEAVDAYDPESIAIGITSASDRRAKVHALCIQEASRFSWEKLAKKYEHIYYQIRNKLLIASLE